VGSWAALFIHEFGGRIIGVAERDGSIYNPKGIDPKHLNDYIVKNKGIKGY